MITPFKPVGAGMTNSINVFRITFSTNLSDIPRLRAYDDYTAASNANTIFTGTTISGFNPLIAAVGGIAPGIATWFPTVPVAGDTTVGQPNMLKGTTYGVKLSSSAPLGGTSVVFNIGYKIPSDITTLATMAAAVVCEYQYTGGVPTVTFSANNGGTEGVPIWTTIDSLPTGTAPTANNVTQIRPSDTGKGDIGGGGDGTFRVTIPSSGSSFPDEIWVKNY